MALSAIRLRARGQVQGVGFRPFVAVLARRLGLVGLVRNDGEGALVEVEGDAVVVASFAETLRAELPPPGRIDALAREAMEPRGATSFVIAESGAGPRAADVTVDCATCADCQGELFAGDARRRGHALITCARCGPRYSIVRRVPWDRPNTSMADFAMCADCAREYVDEGDRRYHAEAIACARCGPRARLVSPDGATLPGAVFDCAAALLASGGILAVKGLGGYHLAVRADDEAAVSRLRARKARDSKPFALMVADRAAALALARLSEEGLRALGSAATPIILAVRREGVALAPSVAPGVHRVGVMLPTTPIQHLLAREPALRGVPLVMTSGNVADEPLVSDDADALARLGPLCDALLVHERPIARAVDDSVLVDFAHGVPVPLRRARGLVPSSILLGEELPDGLALGGDLKGAVAVLRRGRAILGEHLGDLEHAGAHERFARAASELPALFGAEPRFLACDLHPDAHASLYAHRLGRELGLPVLPVQHHHAHAAALLAEHGRREPIVAWACDGFGYGADGTVWGGELLVGDLSGFERVARLRPMRLLGGDAAARDGRRCALALLHLVLGDDCAGHAVALELFPDARERRGLLALLASGQRAPWTSSTGRLFDGVAALLGVASRNRFEAQSAMALEAASRGEAACWTPFALRTAGALRELDPSDFLRSLLEGRARGVPIGALAAAFHEALAEGLAALAVEVARARGLGCVGLTGGSFANERLCLSVSGRLETAGLEVLRHRVVPCGDGGLALGQLALAAHRARSVVTPRNPLASAGRSR